MTWALQEGANDASRIADACEALNIPVVWFSSRPFSDDLPDVPTDQGSVIFYGSPRVSRLVSEAGKWSPGVFGTLEDFDLETQLAQWGKWMLNSQTSIASLETFAAGWLPNSINRATDRIFCRPITDDKLFSGQVHTAAQLQEWARRVIDNGQGGISPDLDIAVSRAVEVSCEWRLFIVNGQVVGSSQYRKGGYHNVSPDAPYGVLQFGRSMVETWSPNSVFALDVAEVAGRLRIVEANGFNSCGFYEADVMEVVAAVTNAIRRPPQSVWLDQYPDFSERAAPLVSHNSPPVTLAAPLVSICMAWGVALAN